MIRNVRNVLNRKKKVLERHTLGHVYYVYVLYNVPAR